MRARRRALTRQQQGEHALQVTAHARRALLLRPGRQVGVYLAYAGEPDLQPLMQIARRSGCTLYLPVISDYRRNEMRFRRFDSMQGLVKNRYGIFEPTAPQGFVDVRRLDVVFTPLVAVDMHGARLGSGAGFYDRCFHHLRAGRKWRRPRLIGVAHDFQRVHELQSAPWDAPLDGLLTERGYYRFPLSMGRP